MDAGTVTCRLLFFAKARELIGRSEQSVQLPRTINTKELEALLFGELAPELGPIRSSCVIAVGQEYVLPDQQLTLSPGIEVAVIPPLSGG
uniref:Molybdopterin synthase sulfur carrier subunit n=1 Tax=Plectus sambesii TaxID=2011161 RepID=A0A914WKB5_9BILA